MNDGLYCDGYAIFFELSFYSKATTDIEYLFPMGWGELWGIADRTDYDLGVHMEHSGVDLRYLDSTSLMILYWALMGRVIGFILSPIDLFFFPIDLFFLWHYK